MIHTIKTIRAARGIRLTSRETEILDCILQGLATSQIAASLRIAENTVYNHRKSILKKKGVKRCAYLSVG